MYSIKMKNIFLTLLILFISQNLMAVTLDQLIDKSFWIGCPSEGDVTSGKEKLLAMSGFHKGLGSLDEGALEEMGGSDYLDRMYAGIKMDFEESGIEFRQKTNAIIATGISLEKIIKDGETKEILVKIDGDLSFDTGSANLTQIAQKLVSQISKAMDAYPETQARVWGHTDSVGSRAFNLPLSKNRAQSVSRKLVTAYGLNAKRISEIRGFADDMKIVPTNGPEAKNRRVEIRLSPLLVDSVSEFEGSDLDIMVQEDVRPAGTLEDDGAEDYFEEYREYFLDELEDRGFQVEETEYGLKTNGLTLNPIMDGSGEYATTYILYIDHEVAFDLDQKMLTPDGEKYLDAFLQTMLAFQETTMKIQVHTGYKRSVGYNLRSSKAVADAVKNHLMKRFEDIEKRISASDGFGDFYLKSGAIDNTGFDRKRIEIQITPSPGTVSVPETSNHCTTSGPMQS